jgi:hypothetical protein
MPRIRSLKYEYFINEELAQISSEARLLGLGITTLADREGRLEDRPLRIKVRLFPYHDVSVDDLLNQLQSARFLERYVVGVERYIQITNFLKHQKPHPQEKPSIIPCREKVKLAPEKERCDQVGNGLLDPDPGSLGSGSSVSGDLGTSGNGDRQHAVRVDKRGTRLPDDFRLTDEIRKWAADKAPHVNLNEALDEFVDYWRGVPGRHGLKLNWEGTFRNRLRELEGRAVKNSRSFKPNAEVSLETAQKVAAKYAGS